MDKTTTIFSCHNCGTTFPGWQGQCSGCGKWNTIEQEIVLKTQLKSGALSKKEKKAPILLNNVVLDQEETLASGSKEVDSVLGKGIVKGSAVLLGGEPGIGKSTLALQIALNVALSGAKVLYVSGEESEQQIFLRAKRIKGVRENLFVYSEVNMASILQTIDEMAPDLVILDSIQVVFHPEIPSIAGSVNQVRQCANEFISKIKRKNLAGIIIGHVTKDGYLAGPKVLEHLVDVILYLEGERNQHYRILRCFKNRYSNTHEIGVFEMSEKGLTEVENPSTMFLNDSPLKSPGSVIAAVAEGSRMILVEIQALVVDSGYGMAKRSFLGVDPNRANVIISTIEKVLKIKLSSKDIVINIIGGLKVKEPGLDLAMVLAILSSFFDQPVGPETGACGEVGLTGEVRAVPYLPSRLLEYNKMGFKYCYVPEGNKKKNKLDIKALSIKTIADIGRIFQQ